ncbi:MAG: S-methyl-5-thioribose-1-phosphate isomerase [Candidatus Riflebacteria bacterium]|nr:S-methyl-5-thioribose-1-phosphate isomerase [Candidatus Riflebacteria bacterium]
MIKTIVYNSVGNTVDYIDQTLLPEKEVVASAVRIEEIAEAILHLRVRGAPAIGIAGAYGIYLAIDKFSGTEDTFFDYLDERSSYLNATRPTAVNLSWAIKRTKKVVLASFTDAEPGKRVESAKQAALREANAILLEDIEMCRKIGAYGAQFVKDGDSWLTHCNAGAFATGGYGTALGVFRAAFEAGRKFHVYVDETRPLLQGARLTAWEMLEEKIPATLICDNMAASLMASGKIQGIVVGADRITKEGYVANKIGTYSIAVLAKYHKVPFYVAAPVSTFDLTISKGSEIVIEERKPEEIIYAGKTLLAPKNMKVYNPAFDVTPPELITAIITNAGVINQPFSENIKKI